MCRDSDWLALEASGVSVLSGGETADMVSGDSCSSESNGDGVRKEERESAL